MEELRVKAWNNMAMIMKVVFKEQVKIANSFGLSSLDFLILKTLKAYGEKSMVEIARELMVSKPAVTFSIDKLEKEKLVERKRFYGDRRITKIAITEKGKEKLEIAEGELLKALGRIMSVLTESEIQCISSVSEKIMLYIKERRLS
jgi:MarR family 2-MHQ and catechol resistance regulon transcriptional repressor